MSPPGSAAIEVMSAMAKACTAASPTAAETRDQRPRATMWAAYRTAEAKVTASPVPTENPRSESSASREYLSPAVATRGRDPVAQQQSAEDRGEDDIGAVMNPEMEASVVSRPVVWSTPGPPVERPEG